MLHRTIFTRGYSGDRRIRARGMVSGSNWQDSKGSECPGYRFGPFHIGRFSGLTFTSEFCSALFQRLDHLAERDQALGFFHMQILDQLAFDRDDGLAFFLSRCKSLDLLSGQIKSGL